MGYLFGASEYSKNSDYVPKSLKKITITNATSIGENAFYYCDSLISITIPNSVTSIGEEAFGWCSKLVEVYNLSSLNIVKSSKDNGIVCYYAKDIYTSLEEPSKLKTINGVVYYINGTEKIAVALEDINTSSIVIDNDCTEIYQYAFKGCSSLTSVTIPNSVTSIGQNSFLGCSSLTSVYYTGTIEDWCNITFCNLYGANPMYYASQFYIKNCNGEYEELTEIEIPNTITKINSYAFYNFNNVTKVTIPEGVTSIGYFAFSGCNNLQEMTLPFVGASETEKTFLGYLFGANGYYDNSDYVPKSLKKVTITSATSIGDSAFEMCSSLTSITIPNSVTSIGKRAFYSCSSLTSITIPNSVTSIGDYAFTGCNSLTEVTIPNSVTSISEGAFYGCSSLIKVYYNGTSSDWNKISIYNYNSNLISATRYYYSETKPTGFGNYWHYDTDGTTILEW